LSSDQEISNSDKLYYRIHKNNVVNGEIVPAAFKPINGGMSTDWSALSTPEKCRLRARNVENNGVVSFVVAEVRAIKPLEVNHTPSENNSSHTDIKHPGANFSNSFPIQIRLDLRKSSNWEINLS